LGDGRLTVNADNPLAVFLFCGLIETSAQICGVMKILNIPWPTSVNQLMTGSSALFTLDADSFALQCAVGSSAITLYCVQVLAVYLVRSLHFGPYFKMRCWHSQMAFNHMAKGQKFQRSWSSVAGAFHCLLWHYAQATTML